MTISRPASRSWLLPLLVVVICGVVFVYRFNTLSGELGGFDNDHFINLARANQLLEGGWPLRDYPDASLQGAWPPLTYLGSAAAQSIFGRSLLAEAYLTVAGIALGASFTLLAAANLTGSPWWGLAAATLSVMPSLKLYGYARPLLFGAALFLLFRCLDVRSPRRLVALAMLLAIAFLVRHDYAVYVAVAWTVASLLRVLRGRRAALLDLGITAAVAFVLLLPTFAIVQRLVGVDRYVATAQALAQDEFNRTNLRWPSFDPSEAASATNAVAYLYYLFLALPLVAVVAAAWRARRGGPTAEVEKVIAVSAMAFLANRYLLRGNVEARLADVAIFAVILGTWLLHVAFAHRAGSVLSRSATLTLRAVALAIAFVATAALGVVGAVPHEIATSKLNEGPMKVFERMSLVRGRLAAIPPSTWPEHEGLDGAMQAAAYVGTCTAPTDRLLVTTSAPEIGVYARRPFAAGHVDFVVGFYNTPDEQTAAVEQAKRESIPIVLTEPTADHERVFATEFPIVDKFLRERYTEAGAITRGGDPYLRVLVRRDLTPLREFPETGLPCFR